jgi:pyruvate dehydrogenase E2 component (dihydrolipoamide acetyltransferase)
LRKEGQWVDKDETVASVEAFKVTVEIKSPTPGLITKLYVKEGQSIEVGRPLFDVDPNPP